MKEFIKKNKDKLIYSIFFIILLLICYFFPYTHDDWAWGSQIGIDRLENRFANYNGRWMGNLLVIILTRNRLVRAVFESVTLTLIVYYINKIVNPHKNSKFMIVLFMLLIPIPILSQGIAWTSGFANYVFPSLVTLIVLYYNRGIFQEGKYEIENKIMIPFIILGFIGTLFVEHMTIYLIILALTMNIIYYLKNKKISIPNLLFLIGVLSGSVLMFSNGAYNKIANNEDGYRTLESANLIVTMITTYFKTLYILLLKDNIILNLIISILLILICKKSIKEEKNNKVKINLLKSVKYFLIGFFIYELYTTLGRGNIVFFSSRLKPIVDCIIMSLYFVSIFVISIIGINKNEIKKRLIFEIISIIIIAGPLLIVKPIGPRCFVPTYFFFAMIALELFNYIFKSTQDTKKISIYVIVILLFSMISTYGFIYKVEYQGKKYMYNNKTEEKIYLPRLPYANYMWCSTPANDVFESRFKKYYKLDEKTDLEFIPYKTWKKKYYLTQ